MIGETIDRKYKLLRLIGKGGMGSVYEAEQQGAGRSVAVKIIDSRLLEDGKGSVARFRREAQAASSIDSEHIVEVFDSGADEASGLLYLVMEHLEGEDLQHLIDRIGSLAPDAALRVAAQALLGLERAHAARVVHRDIKPANLFLARRPGGEITVKILDFGIAKIKPDPLQSSHTTGLTSTGGFLGSPLYMSPEQVVSSGDVDDRTDIWSIGSALYCSLAGHAPHAPARSVAKLILAICSKPPPPLREAAPWVSPEIAKVISGALSLRREDRYPSAAAMLSAMRPLLTGGLALREEMLVPPSEPRSAGGALESAASSAPELEADPGATLTFQGNTTTTGGRPTARSTPRSPAAPASPDEAGEQPADSDGAAVEAKPMSGSTARSGGPKDAGTASAPRRALRAIVGAGAALVLVGVAVWVTMARERPAPLPAASVAATSAQPPPTPPPSVEISLANSAAMNAPPSAAIRAVNLVILPGNATVDVDDERAEVSNGAVLIRGTLGSSHRVRVSRGGRKVEREVLVTEAGAEPPMIELTTPSSPAPAASTAPPLSPPASFRPAPRPPDNPLMP